MKRTKTEQGCLAAYLMVIMAAVLYGIMPSLVKGVYDSGLNGMSVNFYVTLFSLPMLLVWCRAEKKSLKLSRTGIRKCVILGVAETATTIMLFTSYSFIPVSMATMLHYVFPVAVVVISARLFHWKRDPVRLLILLVYGAGIVMLCAGEFRADPAGMLLAFGSGLCWAGFTIYLGVSGVAGEAPCVLSFYRSLVGAVLSGAAGLLLGAPFSIKGMSALLILILCAFLYRILCSTFYQMGARRLSSFVISMLSTLEPVVAVVLSCLLFREQVVGIQWLGVALVMAAVVGVQCNDLRTVNK